MDVRSMMTRITDRLAKSHWLHGLRTLGCFALLGAPCDAPGASRALFDFSSGAEVAAWKPGPAASRPTHAPPGGGARFELPFGAGVDRVYWDRPAELDLSHAEGFQITLSCSRPDAVRTVALYFQSGDGWYARLVPLSGAGVQTLRFPREEFGVEGTPAGWDAVTAVRLSPWKGRDVDAELRLYAFDLMAVETAVIAGGRGLENDEARALSARLAQQTVERLDSLGIASRLLQEDAITADALAPFSTLILPYNSRLSESLYAATHRFIRRGGKALVFYSEDSRLADLMGVELLPYTRAPRFTPWTSFVFERADHWHVPERIYQRTGNLLPARPVGRGGEVIAHWRHAFGRAHRQPAVIATTHGFWITHILQDGHEFGKRMMLGALLGHANPKLLPAAARKAFYFSSLPERFASYADLALTLREWAAGHPRRRDGLREIERGEAMHLRAAKQLQQGRDGEALNASILLRRHWQRVFGKLQRPRPGEWRAVWDHHGTGWSPGHWNATCRELRRSGINAILPNMLNDGIAHYPSRVLTPSRTYETFGDQIDQCLRASRASGLEVHIWKVCWKTHGAPAEIVARWEREGRLQKDRFGETLPWLDPSHPANREQALRSIEEVVRRYEVDGIHLDYIRYPNENAGYSDFARAEFERAAGRTVANWPKDAAPGGPDWPAFNRWRADQITAFVADVRRLLRDIAPGVQLSAAVFGGYPKCVETVAQDWALWLKRDLVDFLCPMSYTADLDEFIGWTTSQMALPNARGRIRPGIGVTATGLSLGPESVVDQIRAVRDLGAPGFALFDLDVELREDILPVLREGLTADPE
jgi:uncharacterized lipoprotein YddW (UPF0748 family)